MSGRAEIRQLGAIVHRVRPDASGLTGEALKSVGHALLGWIVVIIPASVVLTLALLPVFTLLKRRYCTCTKV